MSRPEDRGDSELDRVLGSTFESGKVHRRLARRGRLPLLGEFDSARDKNQSGNAPGILYSGGPQPQEHGPEGQEARKVGRRWRKVVEGIDLSKCGPLADAGCRDLLSRLLEETFRNFQLAARRPSHIDPPFRAQTIDQPSTCPVVIPIGSVFTDVVVVRIPAGAFRAVIAQAGESTDVVVNWNSLTWRIEVDGTPYAPYQNMPMQFWQMVPLSPIVNPIKLRGGQIVKLQAANSSANPINVCGRMAGWFYPVRAEAGEDSIKSTLVD